MASKSIFDDELILPGVITEIVNDYNAGYDTSEFGTTDAVTVIGTAFNGPVGIPIPVFSPEYAKQAFGGSFDSLTRREASLVPEIYDAWDRGCRTIYAIRVSGKEMYKDYEFAIETNLKLRVSGKYPYNENKKCFFFLDSRQESTVNPGVLKIYKPADRTTVQEKLQGVVDNINSVLVNEINLENYSITKSSKLIDLIDLFNKNSKNNVLRLSIVDSEGVELTSSAKEVQLLNVGDLFPGVYTICKTENAEGVIAKTDVQIALINNTTVDKPYNAFNEAMWKKLVINTDVTKPYPLYGEFNNFKNCYPELVIDQEFECYKRVNFLDLMTVNDDVDYEEVELDPFDLYQKLGKGFVRTAKIEQKAQGKYKVVVPNEDDSNRVVGINDGIYSILENHKSDYTVLAGITAETEIMGKLPKKEAFRVADRENIDLKEVLEDGSNGNKAVLQIKVMKDADDFEMPADYKFEIHADELDTIDHNYIVNNISPLRYKRVPVLGKKHVNKQFEGLKQGQLALVIDDSVELDNLFQVIPAVPEHYELHDLEIHGENVALFTVVEEVQDLASEVAAIDVPDFKVGDVLVLIPEVPEEKIAISDGDGNVDFEEIKAGIEFGELYEFNAKAKKFVKCVDNVLGIGVHGQEGYDCARVLVQLGDLLVAFKQDEEDVCKFKLAANALGEQEEIYPFLIADRVVYSTCVSATNQTAKNLVIYDSDGHALMDEDGHVLVYEPENPMIMPFMALKDLAEGVLKEEEFTIIAAEADMPKLPCALSDNMTMINIYSNEIEFSSQEEMVQKFNESEQMKNRFEFMLAVNSSAYDELPEHLAGRGMSRKEALRYDTSLYVPYTTTDNFARHLAQHCLYTQLKTYPTHGIIGCDKLTGVNLATIAQRVDDICKFDFDLYAKKDNGNYMYDSNNEPYPIGRCVSIVFMQYAVGTGDGYNYTSGGAAGYAGMVSALPIDRSSTNQPIAINEMSYELSNYQLGRLNSKGIVCAKNSTNNGVVIVDGITQAPVTSAYRRLSAAKTINAVDKILRNVLEPYIGLMDSLTVRNSMNTAIKSALNDLKEVIIRDYKFKIYTDSSNGNLGVIRIDYLLIPLNEIREIRNRVEITDQF
jgi:hypothetical protein